jgi:hypothetical protein
MRTLCGVAKYSSLKHGSWYFDRAIDAWSLIGTTTQHTLRHNTCLDLPILSYVNAQNIFPVRNPQGGRANEDKG